MKEQANPCNRKQKKQMAGRYALAAANGYLTIKMLQQYSPHSPDSVSGPALFVIQPICNTLQNWKNYSAH